MTPREPARAAGLTAFACVLVGGHGVVCAATVAASAPIPFKPAQADEAGSFGGAWFALVLVLAVAAAIAVLLRRRVHGLPRRMAGSPRAVEVTESSRLGERTRLSVVRWHGRELLLAHGEHSFTVLAEQPATAQGAAP